MRASEALMIGSLQLRAMPYTVDDGQGNGCAIGMLNLATGYDTFFPIDQNFPWLKGMVNLPCKCFNHVYATGQAAMVHLFNEHVCRDFPRLVDYLPDADKWTLEQLADWLEKVDPTPKTTIEEKHDAVEMFCESLVSR